MCASMCLIDATDALDQVNFVKWLKLLLKRNIPSIVLRQVMNLYTRKCVAAT